MPVRCNKSGCKYGDIPGFEEYEIFEDGRVFRKERYETYISSQTTKIVERHYQKKQLSVFEDKDGYLRFGAWKDGKQYQLILHRVLLSVFDRLPKSGEMACHRNGNNKDNRIENLYWGSAKDNADDCELHGNRRRGFRHPKRKLSVETILEIKNTPYQYGIISKLSRKHKCGTSTIHRIMRGKTYANS